ncbi:MAG: NTP transferase domain-containing protein, partial [Candidatus Nanohaloarchaeota archaeon]|nr:NTP transferase domain-containing protein [Candidatus Nanohaloarchaeota archaeon]
MNKKTCGIVIAGGESSRIWPLNNNGKKHKASLMLGGMSLLERTIKALEKYVNEVVVVVSPDHEWEFSHTNPKIAYQPLPLSTADAMIKGYEKCPNYQQYIIINGYHAFSNDLVEKIAKLEANAVLLTSTNEPQNYGIAKIKNNKVIEIVEKPKNAGKEALRVIGVYKVKAELLKYLASQNLEDPYIFEEVLSHFAKAEGLNYEIVKESPLSLKYPWHYLDFTQHFLKKIMVSFIHKQAEIAPTAIIKGKVFIE